MTSYSFGSSGCGGAMFDLSRAAPPLEPLGRMERDELEKLAAGLALGKLTGEERARALELMRRDPAFERAVEEIEQRLAPLATSLPPEAPPPGLFEAIEARIDAVAGALAGTTTLRAGDYVWQPLSAGVDFTVLWRNDKAKRQSLLIRMQPGAAYEAHDHADDEECLVVEGDLKFGELLLKAGDFHFAPRGCTHPAAYSPSGCLLFVTTAA